MQSSTTAPRPIPFGVRRIAAVIVFGAFMSGLDTSVVNVGLDSIARDLGTDLATAQWASNAYLVALGVSLPVCGHLGRRIGVGRLWLHALTAFTATSVLCAFAPNIGWLIALRVAQGASAGLLIPAGQTILGQAVGPQLLGRVMSTLGIAVTAAPAIGPVLGGTLIEAASWPWLFLVNLPIGVVGVALGYRYIPRGAARETRTFDVIGAALLITGLPLAVFGITSYGEQQTLSAPIVFAPLAIAALALGSYVIHSRRTEHPIMDPTLFGNQLFANQRYAAATTTATLSGAALFGAALLFPLYFQIGRGQSSMETGLLLIASSVGTIAALPWSGRLVDRYGGGVVGMVGGITTVSTTIPFVFLDIDANLPLVQCLLVLRGIAIAFTVVPATTSAYKAVTTEQLPDATTQVNIGQRLGGAVGGSVIAVLLAQQLPSSADHAFHLAFACLAVPSAIGLATTAWLARAEHSIHPLHTFARSTTNRKASS